MNTSWMIEKKKKKNQLSLNATIGQGKGEKSFCNKISSVWETAFFPHLWMQKYVFQRSLHNFIPFFLPLCPGGPKANLRRPRMTQGWGCLYNLLLSPWAQGSKDQPKSMAGLLLTSLGVAHCPSSRSRSYCLVGPLKLGTSCNWSNAGLTAKGTGTPGYTLPC